MHLTELKNTPVSDLVKLKRSKMGLENLACLRKQDIVSCNLKTARQKVAKIFSAVVC